MAQINYQARDFEGIKQSLIEYARQNFPDWTDLNESEQGMILVELYAYMADGLHYYIDRQTDEFDIGKTTQRKNMLGLMKLISYRMRGATAATAQVAISTADGVNAVEDVPIPQGFKIYTKDPRSSIVYEVLAAGLKIAKGTNSVTITVTEGETIEEYRTFTGTADQVLQLERTPYLQGSVTVINNEQWDEVEGLLDSESIDRHFFVEIQEDDSALLRFGDGVAGAVPSGSGEISYRIGGGIAGQVGPNTLTVPESPQLLNIYGVPVSILCNNPASSAGGEDKESIEQARIKGPNAIKANTRTVGGPDFNNHSAEVDGVLRAFARFRKDDLTIPQNIAKIQILPVGGGNPTQTVKDAVEEYLYNEKPVPSTMVVEPINPKYYAVNVTATVIAKPGYTAEDVKTRTAAAITAYLSDYEATNIDGSYILNWGITIYPDDLAIKVEGCRSITLTVPAAPVVVPADQIPKPGTIGVS